MGGYAGMFSFGQAAFFGIGAYASSWLLTAHGVNPWLGLLVGGVLAALTAAAIGWPCSKLRGHYFAIASIAFAEIVRIHFNNWKLVGAAEGLTIPMATPGLLTFQFHGSKAPYYYIALAFLMVGLLVSRWVATSRAGFYFRAIKESHELAMVLGISFVRYRLLATMLAAFLSAAAGTFYAQYILYLDPESVIILPISVQVVLVSMLGGAGTILGPVVGAAILVPISEITRVQLGYKGTGVDMMVYGALIWLISVYQPKGVWGFLVSLGQRRSAAPAPAPEAGP
jgi:branched-chain amino acid transport system permease protein